MYRQERPGAEAPQPGPAPRAELNGLVFKQSRRGDALIVSRTLTARLAAPHSLHLDNLRLKECCIVEGEGTTHPAWPVQQAGVSLPCLWRGKVSSAAECC